MSGPLSTSPHLFSSAHGVVINDANQYQFGGGINDAGTLVWAALSGSSAPTQFVFQATWIPSPSLTLLNTSGLTLQWPTNAAAFHVQYTTSVAPPITWQRLSGTPSTNSVYLQQSIGPSLGGAAFFRLSTGAP